jgi:hypothetical protein
MTLILYVVLLAYMYVFACQSPWRELRNVKGVVSEGVDCNRGVVLDTGKAFDNCYNFYSVRHSYIGQWVTLTTYLFEIRV